MKRLIVPVLLALTLAAPVLAAKPYQPQKAVGVITGLVGEPVHGSQVAFTVETDARTSVVGTDCYQDGVWVYTTGRYAYREASYTSRSVTLASLSWTEGPASCVTTLESYWNDRFWEMDALEFEVAP